MAIFKQKYTAAIEKVHKVQGQVRLLEEELQFSQQQVRGIDTLRPIKNHRWSSTTKILLLVCSLWQLRQSQLASRSNREELAELERRYQEKVNQWESSQEALEQLTDELQAGQNLLREGEQKVHHFKHLAESLQEQVDSLNRQVTMRSYRTWSSWEIQS